MSEERLQEIKDSIELQYTLAKAKGYDNALLFTNEEEELVDEVERLTNIIKKAREYIEKYLIQNDITLQDYQNKYKELLEILDKVGETDVKD